MVIAVDRASGDWGVWTHRRSSVEEEMLNSAEQIGNILSEEFNKMIFGLSNAQSGVNTSICTL